MNLKRTIQPKGNAQYTQNGWVEVYPKSRVNKSTAKGVISLVLDLFIYSILLSGIGYILYQSGLVNQFMAYVK